MSWYSRIVIQRNADVLAEYGNKQLVYDGESRTLSEWATHLKVQPYTMADRIMKMRRGQYTSHEVFRVNQNRKRI